MTKYKISLKDNNVRVIDIKYPQRELHVVDDMVYIISNEYVANDTIEVIEKVKCIEILEDEERKQW